MPWKLERVNEKLITNKINYQKKKKQKCLVKIFYYEIKTFRKRFSY